MDDRDILAKGEFGGHYAHACEYGHQKSPFAKLHHPLTRETQVSTPSQNAN
jgi:hypothetical protein